MFKSTILESGVVLSARTGTDANKTSFSFVAQKLGCPLHASPADEIACMRKIDASTIEKFLLNYTDSGATPPVYFSASVDGKVAFLPQQYIAMGEAGNYANLVRNFLDKHHDRLTKTKSSLCSWGQIRKKDLLSFHLLQVELVLPHRLSRVQH